MAAVDVVSFISSIRYAADRAFKKVAVCTSLSAMTPSQTQRTVPSAIGEGATDRNGRRAAGKREGKVTRTKRTKADNHKKRRC
jgi:hypothetical protein